MSLENDLNQIEQNVSEVYAAGQKSVDLSGKMDKFGTLTLGNSVEDIPDKISVDGCGLRISKNGTISGDFGIEVNYLGTFVFGGANQNKDRPASMLWVTNGGMLFTSNTEHEGEELSFTPLDADNLLQAKGIKMSGTQELMIEGQERIVLKVKDNYLIMDDSGIGAANIDTVNWTENLLPFVGSTNEDIEYSYVNIKYLKDYIKTLEERITALEGGTK